MARTRILVVDDDPAVRVALCRILALRHDVVSAASVAEALELLGADATFDVVVCDVVMPEATGLDLLRELRARHPALERRVVLITGGAISRQLAADLDNVSNEIVHKPFGMERLEAAIARALAQ